MGGKRLARAALAFDAVYCAIVGLLVVALRARLGGLLQVPSLVVAAAGVATVGWAGIVLGQAVRRDWRTAIKQSMVVNAGVAVLLTVAFLVWARVIESVFGTVDATQLKRT